jgi:hypothetical protein
LEEVEDEVVGGRRWLVYGYGFMLCLVWNSGLGGGFYFILFLVVVLGVVAVCSRGFYAALFWWPYFLGGDEGLGCSDNGFGGDLLLRRQFRWWWFKYLVF